MATKRKISEQETEGEMEKKRARTADDLHLQILSSFDIKYAVQTSILSKTWVSLWKSLPVLDFNYKTFKNNHAFDKFVNQVLYHRDPTVKLDRLTFTQIGICNATILKNVFDYASSHGVKQLESFIYNVDSREITWPVCHNTSFDSLTSLKLQSAVTISCPYLGPRSRSFKNLTALYLTQAIITDIDPFSGFPVLKKLTLVDCDISTDDKTLHVNALNLSELTFSTYQKFTRCQLTTPKLSFLEYRGCDFLPLFRTNTHLPVLDTMVIDCGSYRPQEKRMFGNLLSLFWTLDNVKSLKLSWSTIEIMSSFREELLKRSSPFRNLKCLKLDFRYGFNGSSKSNKIAADVKGYLLQNSPDAEVTTIYRNR